MADQAPTPSSDTTPTSQPNSPSTTTTPEANSTSPATQPSESADASAPLLAEESNAEPATPESKESVPDKYSAYKVPEGYELDEETVSKANDLFKKSKLTQADAQAFIDMYIDLSRDAMEAPYKAFNDLTKQWKDEAMNHPDLKGKLGAGKEVSVKISKMLNDLGDPQLVKDFRQAMDLTGAGNHPAFIRMLAKAAEKLVEGGHVSGAGPSPHGQTPKGQASPPSAARALWPTLPSNNG